MKFILIIIYIAFSLGGLILIKKGQNPGTIKILEKKDLNITINFISLLGFICYLCSFLLFTKIILMFDLSYIMPIVTGIVQIMTLVVAKVFFHENISKKSIIGAGIVIIGILIMNLKIA